MHPQVFAQTLPSSHELVRTVSNMLEFLDEQLLSDDESDGRTTTHEAAESVQRGSTPAVVHRTCSAGPIRCKTHPSRCLCLDRILE